MQKDNRESEKKKQTFFSISFEVQKKINQMSRVSISEHKFFFLSHSDESKAIKYNLYILLLLLVSYLA